MSDRRGLVILAGWLGCQPRYLKRYQALYRRLGWDSLSYIAPPAAVVGAVLRPSRGPTMCPPPNWPLPQQQSTSDKTIEYPETVQDLAWDVLRDVASRANCSHVVFHAFSNGGCFVWEEVRMILDSIETTTSDHDSRDLLEKLRYKLVGVIFDSAPIADLHLLENALVHCTPDEQEQITIQCGGNVSTILQQSKPIVDQRIDSYVTNLRNDPWTIPQLYLYSRNDALAPSRFIEDLVLYRKSRIGQDKILEQVWDRSAHCAHLLEHPDEYSQAVQTFVNLCTRNRLPNEGAAAKL